MSATLSDSLSDLIKLRDWSQIRDRWGHQTASYLERLYAVREPRAVEKVKTVDYATDLAEKLSVAKLTDGTRVGPLKLSLIAGISHRTVKDVLSGRSRGTPETIGKIDRAMERIASGLPPAEAPKFAGKCLSQEQSEWVDRVRDPIKRTGGIASFARAVGVRPKTLYNISCKMYAPSPELRARIEARLKELESA